MNIHRRLRSTAFLSLAAGLLALAPARAADTVLHSFSFATNDGRDPYGSVTLSGSKLYGMTQSGGSDSVGTIFNMNTDGTGFGLLHSFTVSATDGRTPYGSLTLSGSKLYGMTYQGGVSNYGTVFSMNIDGSGFAMLHSFNFVSSDGADPGGSLTLSGSKLYGMTADGGSNGNGTLFSINTDGTGFGLVHSFTGSTSDGANPYGSLMLSGSKFYGMTNLGGSSNAGMLFSLNTDGTGYAPIHSFTGGASHGAFPQYSDPALSDDGSMLYGMTYKGGTSNRGVVFSETIVPEPSTALLLAAGAGLMLRRRRG